MPVAEPHRLDERQAEESAEEAEAAAAASEIHREGEALEEGDAVAAAPPTATQEAQEPAQGEAAAGAAAAADGSVSPAASIADATRSGPRVLLAEGSDRIGGRGGRGRGGSGTQGNDGGNAGRVHGRARLQPAPRRLGAALAPGRPRPLRGWHKQEQTPQEPELQPPLPTEQEVNVADAATTQRQQRRERPQRREAGEPAPNAPPTAQRAARGAARVCWVAPATPWRPGGRAVGNGGAAVRGRRGRGARARAPPEPTRTGPWRARHGREIPTVVGGEGEEDDADHSSDDAPFMASATPSSEEILLAEEGEEGRRGIRNRQAQHPTARGEAAQANPEDDVANGADSRAQDVLLVHGECYASYHG
ncbi:unnamed protein product [Closterium sp. Naga37s-1]|nr:unnamed protein product [Closterium sp. Naga37s-1]